MSAMVHRSPTRKPEVDFARWVSTDLIEAASLVLVPVHAILDPLGSVAYRSCQLYTSLCPCRRKKGCRTCEVMRLTTAAPSAAASLIAAHRILDRERSEAHTLAWVQGHPSARRADLSLVPYYSAVQEMFAMAPIPSCSPHMTHGSHAGMRPCGPDHSDRPNTA